MRLKLLIRTFLAFSLFGTLCTAQQDSSPPKQAGKNQQDEVVRITTNLVQFDVVVTDKEGRQITDLSPEDFEISEGGKRQQITHFSYISAVNPKSQSALEGMVNPKSSQAATPTMVPPAPLRREQVRRTIALVVDDLGLSFESVGLVRTALKRFVDEQMQPNDLVAILRTSSGTGVLQQFTSDKRLLYRAIERVRWYPQGRSGLSVHETLNEDSAGGDRRDIIQATQEMEESRAGSYTAGTFNTVGSIVRGLEGLPGRKSLVLFSEAFRLSSAQGRNVPLLNAMRRLTEQANAASVSLYTIDSSGLAVDAFDASDQPGAPSYVISPQEFAMTAGGTLQTSVRTNAPPRILDRADTLAAQAERDSGNAFRRLNALMEQRNVARNETHTVLSFLASKTGGLFMRNRNDLGNALQRIVDDQRGYYLIGYRPTDAPTDPIRDQPRMRDISVKVKRSGSVWRTREGYFGITDDKQRTSPPTRAEQLALALTSPFASSDITVRLTSLFGIEPSNMSPYIRSLVHVDASDLSFKQDGNVLSTELEVVVVAYGDNGQVVDQMSYPQIVRAQDETEHQRLKRDGLIYMLNFPTKKPGAYQIRVAVRDSSSEKTGAAMQFIEVPNLEKKRLELSGIVVSGMVQPAIAEGAAASATLDLQASPAVRRLRQGMLLDYRYNILNAQLDMNGHPQLQAQMRLFRDGKEVFTGKVQAIDAQQQNVKRLSSIGRIRIGPELVPGEYILQVTVTDLVAAPRRTATQFSDFEIVQ